MILQHLDAIGKTQGIRVSRFVTGNKKGALIYDVDGEKFELCLPKLAMTGAFHRDFSSPLKARIKGQEYYIASQTTNHTTHLLIEEDMIDRVPFSALLGLMHEAGHEDEKVNGIISTYQAGKGQTRQGRACTEYSSTRLPIKLGMNEYLRTGNARIIPHVAAEVAIFNWVVHG